MKINNEDKNWFLKPEQVINLDRYPIEDINSLLFKALIQRLRKELDQQQYVVLPDFIQPKARQQAIEQIESVLHLANDNHSDRNCYLQREPDRSFPQDHPRNIFLPASIRMIAADLLPSNSPLKTLYYWDKMKKLVAGIVGVDDLYDNEDSLQPVNALCYRNGDRSGWHFDSTNAFTMTLMLQAPDQGGNFEMHPNTRTNDDQSYDRARKVVSGNNEGVVEVGREEGSLCIFRGCNSLHRVSPVKGDRLRMMGVFVYENETGITGDPEVNETVYGRKTAFLAN
jgi:hypothetical protein